MRQPRNLRYEGEREREVSGEAKLEEVVSGRNKDSKMTQDIKVIGMEFLLTCEIGPQGFSHSY